MTLNWLITSVNYHSKSGSEQWEKWKKFLKSKYSQMLGLWSFWTNKEKSSLMGSSSITEIKFKDQVSIWCLSQLDMWEYREGKSSSISLFSSLEIELPARMGWICISFLATDSEKATTNSRQRLCYDIYFINGAQMPDDVEEIWNGQC